MNGEGTGTERECRQVCQPAPHTRITANPASARNTPAHTRRSCSDPPPTSLRNPRLRAPPTPTCTPALQTPMLARARPQLYFPLSLPRTCPLPHSRPCAGKCSYSHSQRALAGTHTFWTRMATRAPPVTRACAWQSLRPLRLDRYHFEAAANLARQRLAPKTGGVALEPAPYNWPFRPGKWSANMGGVPPGSCSGGGGRG